MRAVQAVTVAAAALLLLLSFSYFEPLHMSSKGGYERTASSFTLSSLGVAAGLGESSGAPVVSGAASDEGRNALIVGLTDAMRRAAEREDFDEAKRIKRMLEQARKAPAQLQPPPVVVSAVPARPLAIEPVANLAANPAADADASPSGNQEPALSAHLPILKRRKGLVALVSLASDSAASRGGYPGCLVQAWSSVWLVHPNGTRSFLIEPPGDCIGRATAAEVSQIAKNEGEGRTYKVSDKDLIALICSNAGCPRGPLSSGGGSGEVMNQADEQCVMSALEATPLPPVTPTWTQPAGEFQLSKQLVERFASPARQIIVTFVNFHYLSFAITWVHHLRSVGCNHFLVGAMDNQVIEELRSRQIQFFSIADGGVVTRDLGWGSPAFKKAQQVKVQMFADVLAHGYDAFLADIDAIFMRDPLPYLRCFPEADMLVSSDHLHNSTTDGGLELSTSAHATMNANKGATASSAHLKGDIALSGSTPTSTKTANNPAAPLPRRGAVGTRVAIFS
mmetsp:Transcript_10463/g.25093  ORF Transcript_10463/g.25093 Transcript_10463/m.25093 type:complete len:507 (+) Transcript_10463:71-1591(+)